MLQLTVLRTLALIFILVLCCTSPTHSRLYKRHYHYKPPAGQSHLSIYESSPPTHSHEQPTHPQPQVFFDFKQPSSPSSSSNKPGYSIGSGLRSIAQGSANQAHTAVANQHAAAKQAAFVAKNTLAQAAMQAAATAQAALAGKQVLLQELEHQAVEAQRALGRELEQLKAASVAAKLAQQTAEAAFHHVSVLTAAVNDAKSVAEQAEQAANEVSNQLASQSSMVGQAKNKLQEVEEQLKQARVDFAATKEATLKAAASAAEAQVNASKAAAHATVGLHESGNSESEHVEENYDEHESGGEVEHVRYEEEHS